jgi:hypothetical protein
MIRANVESVTRINTPATRTLVHGADGNSYESKTSQDDAYTQQPLASQSRPRSPSIARPSSRDSAQSQNADTKGHVAPNQMSTRHKMSIAAITVPNNVETPSVQMSNMQNRRSLLQLLKKRSPIISPKGQPQQVTLDDPSHENTNGASVSDSVASRGEVDGRNQVIVRPGKSDDVGLPSQGQAATIASPRPQTLLVENTNAPLGQPLNQINPQSQEEVTSFQKVLTSPQINTSPIIEATVRSNTNAKTDEIIENLCSTETTGTKTNSESDPWNNMTKLGQRDVTIPKDQEELLDRHDCWIPADVGEPIPRGHVPTALLQECSAKMTRLFEEKRKDASSQKVDSSPEREEEGAPPSSAMGHLSENDSDSDSEALDWPPSPPQHMKRPRAPSDSPIRKQSIPKPVESSEQSAHKTTGAVDGISHKGRSYVTLPTSPPSLTTHEDSPTQETNDPNGDQSQNSILSSAPHPITNVLSKEARSENEAAESSDESDMETSIPQALTTSSQNITSHVDSSEPIAPGSSNTSSAPVGRVQILDTPAAALKRKTSKKADILRNLSLIDIFQSSSDGTKSSSQVVANFVDSTGNALAQERDEIDYTQRSLVADSQHTNSDLHDSSLPSHQDSQRIDVVPESSLNSTDLHTQVHIRDDHTMSEQTNSDSNPPTAAGVGGNLKRKAEELQPNDEGPFKRPKQVVNRDIRTTDTQITVHLEPEYVHEDRHKQIFSITPDGPLKIFEMFKKSYPKYAGDFDHFLNLCRRLQSLRGRGVLQKCFLWDEFVMRHLLDYRTYVQVCSFAKRHWENYEEYFCNKFTQPSFKQRSLTPRTLDTVAPKHDESVARMIVTVDRETQTITSNLANAYVTPQPPSFAVDLGTKATLVNQNLFSSDPDSMLVIDKPTQANIGVKLSTSVMPTTSLPCMVDAGIQANLEAPTPSLERSILVENQNQIIEETQALPINDVDMSESEINDDLSDDERHETASIELGDELPKEAEHGDDDYDYDDDARINLLSAIQRESHQAVRSLFNTAFPEPARDLRHLDKETLPPFMEWAEHNENLPFERRETAFQMVTRDEDGDISMKGYTFTKSKPEEEKGKENASVPKRVVFNAFRKPSPKR